MLQVLGLPYTDELQFSSISTTTNSAQQPNDAQLNAPNKRQKLMPLDKAPSGKFEDADQASTSAVRRATSSAQCSMQRVIRVQGIACLAALDRHVSTAQQLGSGQTAGPTFLCRLRKCTLGCLWIKAMHRVMQKVTPADCVQLVKAGVSCIDATTGMLKHVDTSMNNEQVSVSCVYVYTIMQARPCIQQTSIECDQHQRTDWHQTHSGA